MSPAAAVEEDEEEHPVRIHKNLDAPEKERTHSKWCRAILIMHLLDDATTPSDQQGRTRFAPSSDILFENYSDNSISELSQDEIVFTPDDENNTSNDEYDTPQVLLTPPMLNQPYHSVTDIPPWAIVGDYNNNTSPVTQPQHQDNGRRLFLKRKKKSTIRLPDVPTSFGLVDEYDDNSHNIPVSNGATGLTRTTSILHAGASTSRTVAWLAKTLKRRSTNSSINNNTPSSVDQTSITFEEAAGSFVGNGSHLSWLRNGTEATLIVTQKGYAVAASVTVKLSLVPATGGSSSPTVNVAHEPLLLIESHKAHQKRALILDTSRLPTTDPKVLEGLKEALPANESTAEVLANIGNHPFVSIPVTNAESKGVVLLLKDSCTAQRTIDAIMALQTYVQVYGCPTITNARARAAA